MLYEFEGLQLDTSRRRLSRKAGDEVVPLTAKPLDALIHLVEHRDELVEKEALLKALWPRVVVEDNSLERCISTLRRALGESAGENRFIATIPGRGYRFVAGVTVTDAPATAARHRQGWKTPTLAAAALALVALATAAHFVRQDRDAGPRAPVLLVRPFGNTSGMPDDDRVASGMTDELRQKLTALREVGVTTREDSDAITHAIDGSLYRSGDALRIHVALTDIRDGRQSSGPRTTIVAPRMSSACRRRSRPRSSRPCSPEGTPSSRPRTLRDRPRSTRRHSASSSRPTGS